MLEVLGLLWIFTLFVVRLEFLTLAHPPLLGFFVFVDGVALDLFLRMKWVRAFL